MKLLEMRTRDPVASDDNTPLTHFTETRGYTMSLEQGIVTVIGKGIAAGRGVPLSNVAYYVAGAVKGK